MESYQEDVWDISSWRSDIPNKVAYIKRYLNCQPFAEGWKQALELLGSYYATFPTVNPIKPGLFITAFIDEVIDYFALNKNGMNGKQSSAVQELQMLQLLCGYFESQPSDTGRSYLFDALFGLFTKDVTDGKCEQRAEILTKLISMAVALQCSPVLECAAVWMQRHCDAKAIVKKMASSVVDDYTSLVPASIPLLEVLTTHSPLMASQLLIVLTHIYLPASDGGSLLNKKSVPPLSLLSVIVNWVCGNPNICVMSPPWHLVSLSSIQNSSPFPVRQKTVPCHPMFGLVRWTVLAPLLCKHYQSNLGGTSKVKLLYSQLHLAILQALLLVKKQQGESSLSDQMELEPGEVEDEDGDHLIMGADLRVLSAHIWELSSQLLKDETIDYALREQHVQLSLDRFAEIIQVAMTTGNLSSNKDELADICKTLPSNALLSTVIDNLNMR